MPPDYEVASTLHIIDQRMREVEEETLDKVAKTTLITISIFFISLILELHPSLPI